MASYRTVGVRPADPRAEQMHSADNAERDVAVTIVSALPESGLLVAVQKIVRSVKAEHDPLGSIAMRHIAASCSGFKTANALSIFASFQE